MADRPLGVTIICILQFIGAIILIILGALLVLGGLFLGPLLAVVGAVFLVLGLISFFVTFGLWKLKSWAFWITIIINIIEIVTGIGSAVAAGDYSPILSIIIPLIVVIYLFTVRDHFR
jgi:uncharacterized membrane protein (DUF2068 family)